MYVCMYIQVAVACWKGRTGGLSLFVDAGEAASLLARLGCDSESAAAAAGSDQDDGDGAGDGPAAGR